MGQSIIIIGATGLVGSEILKQALHDPRFSIVKSFTRKPTGLKHAKHVEFIVDFNSIDSWKHDLTGDILFSAMGTTRSLAGSIEGQRTVDYDYQFQVAKAACENGVKNFVLISSIGANPDSRAPYTKMKGELDRDVQKLGFQRTLVLRPGPLEGPRGIPRFSEKVLTTITYTISRVGILKSLRPVSGKHVAHVAIESALSAGPGHRILEAMEILKTN